MFMEPNFQVETAHDQDAYNNMVTAHYMLHEKNSIKSLYALAVVLALCVWWIAAGGNYTCRPSGVSPAAGPRGEGGKKKQILRHPHPLPLL